MEKRSEGEQPGSAPGRRKSDHERQAEAQRVRVLAVDDNQPYLNYLRLLLTRSGFDVEIAHDGPSALAKLGSGNDFDLLLLDLSMPGMDGIQVVQQLRQRERGPGLYTILLTAHEGMEMKLRALDSGLDDFLSKTSADTEIVAKLRSAARRMEMERRLQSRNEELETLALTDELTGMANRRALTREGEQVLGEGRNLSVVIFDLDQFKAVNDTFGHLVGDRILIDVADMFKTHTRVCDLIARYGGDEFVLLLPDTGAEEAEQIAERVLGKIRQLHWTILDTSVRVSASYGLVSSQPGQTLLELLGDGDAALYRQKRAKAETAVSTEK